MMGEASVCPSSSAVLRSCTSKVLQRRAAGREKEPRESGAHFELEEAFWLRTLTSANSVANPPIEFQRCQQLQTALLLDRIYRLQILTRTPLGFCKDAHGSSLHPYRLSSCEDTAPFVARVRCVLSPGNSRDLRMRWAL